MTTLAPEQSPGRDTLTLVAWRLLQPHPKAQRALQGRRVKQLIRDWNPSYVNCLIVAEDREDGGLYIIDGQHRWHAAVGLGLSNQEVPCLIKYGLTLEEMADQFLGGNDARVVPAFEKHRVGLVAGRPPALTVASLASRYGWEVAKTKGTGRIMCVNTLERAAARGPEAVDFALDVATRAWGHDPKAGERPVLEGLIRVYGAHGSLDRRRLAEKLRSRYDQASTFIGRAKQLHLNEDESGSSTVLQAANLAIKLWNHGLRGDNRLAPIR